MDTYLMGAADFQFQGEQAVPIFFVKNSVLGEKSMVNSDNLVYNKGVERERTYTDEEVSK